MVFKHINVAHFKACPVEYIGCGVSWPQQQLVLGVLRDVGELAEVGLRLEPQLFGFLLCHDETGRGAVSQKGRVGCCHSAVGFDESSLQLGHLLRG